MVSRLSSVGKVTGCTIRSSIYGSSKSFFLSSAESPDRPEREANHSPAPSADFNIEWSKAAPLHGQHSVHCALCVSVSGVNRLVFVMETYCVFFEVRTEYLYITCRAILVFDVVLCPLARCPLVVISTLNTVRAHTDRPL
jgi:hypothetical protein